MLEDPRGICEGLVSNRTVDSVAFADLLGHLASFVSEQALILPVGCPFEALTDFTELIHL
jgi:hypothetical protein